MRTMTAIFGLMGAVVLMASTAHAQNGTNAAPPSAQKEGGTEGDPSGAIRAMGGTEATGFEQKGTVTVPQLGDQGKETTRRLPPGSGGASR